jgi:hypothetical protein
MTLFFLYLFPFVSKIPVQQPKQVFTGFIPHYTQQSQNNIHFITNTITENRWDFYELFVLGA